MKERVRICFETLNLQKSKSSFELRFCNIVVLHLMSASASWTMGPLLRLTGIENLNRIDAACAKPPILRERSITLPDQHARRLFTRTRDHPLRNIT
ncbi:hypothetical protein [Bradyrhizobium sp. USDA 4473]